jgi:hypothetical protein
MKAQIKVNAEDIHRKLNRLGPGGELYLKKGRYPDPITIIGKRGSEDCPIYITGPGAIFGSDMDFDAYRETANKLAAAHQKGGSFPGIYFMADNAALTLRDCQWVIIDELVFRNCWPTAIYLDNCQHIFIRRVDFRGGCIAIGAAGPYTRHLLIEKCSWVQDTKSHGEDDVLSIRDNGYVRADLSLGDCRLWSDIPWKQVHGSGDEDGPVDPIGDARAYDGDFFRAWTIAGYVIIRDNVITDAFNGVHFFNQASESTKEAFARNVLIEDNWFVRIKDNAVEPENFAWNWTIRRNQFVDCYMPFSFEMQRSGYFYVYGNLGWNVYIPGPEDDKHAKGALFKFPDTHIADGPHYVFNNTWLLRAPIAKKKRFAKLEHRNNLIGYATDADKFKWEACSPFGPGWSFEPYPLTEVDDLIRFEEGCFTRSWRSLGIVFDGDVISHPDFPDRLRQAHYDIGKNATYADVQFQEQTIGLPSGLKITKTPPAVAFSIELPDKSRSLFAPSDYCVGAWQETGRIDAFDPSFAVIWPTPARYSEGDQS